MKSLKQSARNIIFISLLCYTTGYAQFLFTPFENETSYNGAWSLSQEVPNYIAAFLREFHKVNVLSATAFLSIADDKNIDASAKDLQTYSAAADELGLTYAVTGKVLDFDIGRFTAGESNLAGYEAYSCQIKIAFQIFDLQKSESVFSENVEASVSSRGLGLNLFGVPSDDKRQYLALDHIKFGSEEFNKTIVGETMLNLCEDLSTQILNVNRELLRPKKDNKVKAGFIDKALDEMDLNVRVIRGLILTYDEETGEAFINLGSANNINEGDELSVYSPADSLFDPATNEFLGIADEEISTLEVIEIRGEKLSLAVALKNLEKLRKGFEIRKVMLKREE